jgi:nitric oxide reductase large subunit
VTNRSTDYSYSNWVNDQHAKLKRQHRNHIIENAVLGIAVFFAALYLLSEPVAYAVARLWR